MLQRRHGRAWCKWGWKWGKTWWETPIITIWRWLILVCWLFSPLQRPFCFPNWVIKPPHYFYIVLYSICLYLLIFLSSLFCLSFYKIASTCIIHNSFYDDTSLHFDDQRTHYPRKGCLCKKYRNYFQTKAELAIHIHEEASTNGRILGSQEEEEEDADE